MLVDDPKFPRGCFVSVVIRGTPCIGTVVKAIKGREYMTVQVGWRGTTKTIIKANTRVVSKEKDPELFI